MVSQFPKGGNYWELFKRLTYSYKTPGKPPPESYASLNQGQADSLLTAHLATEALTTEARLPTLVQRRCQLAPAIYIACKRDPHEDLFLDWVENHHEVLPEETSLGLLWDMIPELPGFATLATSQELPTADHISLRSVQVTLEAHEDISMGTHVYTDGGVHADTLEASSHWQI